MAYACVGGTGSDTKPEELSMGNESMIRTSTLCFPAVGDVTLKPAEDLMIPDCGVHPEQIYDRPNSGRANCSFHAITTCETLESNCSFSIFFLRVSCTAWNHTFFLNYANFSLGTLIRIITILWLIC